ncbi:MAG: biotin/lipoyl-binding protein [Myxococcota bacterium]
MDDSRITDVLRRRLVPLLLWGGLVAAAVWIYQGVGTNTPVPGFAETLPFRLSTTEPARVESVVVKVGDHVREGDVLATLDASAINAEIKVVESDKARVLAELGKTEIEARAAHLEQTRTQAGDEGQVARAARDAKTRLETARAELKAVDSELGRRAPLVKDGTLRAQDLTDLQIKKASLSKQVAEEQAALTMLGGQADTARTFVPPNEDTWVDAMKAPLTEQVKMLDSQLQLLRVRRDAYVLRAPTDGAVTTVAGGRSSVVTPGEPFIEIVAETSGRIVACVLEGVHDPVAPGGRAVARPLSDRNHELVGHSVAVSPVMQLPARCQRDPRVPVWGRIVTVELVPPTALVPGEAFEVRFDAPSGT